MGAEASKLCSLVICQYNLHYVDILCYVDTPRYVVDSTLVS